MTSYQIGPDDRRAAARVALNLISGCLADLDESELERFSGELFRETINSLTAKELIALIYVLARMNAVQAGLLTEYRADFAKLEGIDSPLDVLRLIGDSFEPDA